MQLEIQSDEEKNRIENEKLEKLSLEIQCETDDERKYVLMIQKQKMEREQVIRQKEMKRKLEVIAIRFIEIKNILTVKYCYIIGLAI